MNYDERTLKFQCAGESLIGVVSMPQTPNSLALVVVVGGPQYRVGSHRQFVFLARRLAEAGHAVLRFDYRGMGDSSGTMRGFEEISSDIGAAVDALQRATPAIRRIVLWGLCDGASAALLYWAQTSDQRVAGLCLANPWVRSATGLARTHVRHYYVRRLKQSEFWLKMLRGSGVSEAVAGFVRNSRLALRRPEASLSGPSVPFQERMAEAMNGFPGCILLLLSGNDYTAKEFLELTRSSATWQRALARDACTIQEVPAADHTFSGPQSRDFVAERTLRWLGQLESRRHNRRGEEPSLAHLDG